MLHIDFIASVREKLSLALASPEGGCGMTVVLCCSPNASWDPAVAVVDGTSSSSKSYSDPKKRASGIGFFALPLFCVTGSLLAMGGHALAGMGRGI